MRVLLVDDDQILLKVMTRYLQGQGYEVDQAASAAEAMARVSSTPPEVVFLDLFLPDQSGLQILTQIRDKSPLTSVVMMSGGNTTKSSVSAIRMGADDCLDKPFPFEEMKRVIDKVTESKGFRSETSGETMPKSFAPPQYLKEHLFLRDTSMTDIYEKITQVAKADGVTVLILGETGTGKQHAARLIHHLSGNRKAPFVEQHCGALPEELLESELFGCEADASVDGKNSKPGLMEAAQGGTLFLDEIGEMPLSVQAKLLKVLEQKRVRRLGGSREIQLNIRLVAATNRDLQADMKSGHFRSDLYYRLNLMNIKMPPLRGRREAIETLARFFADEVCGTYTRARVSFSTEVLAAFSGYGWPGNVRELKNVISRMVLSTSERDLRFSHLPDELKCAPNGLKTNLAQISDGVPVEEKMATFDDVEKETIVKALKATQWNRTRAAEALGISRRTIINKIHKWNLSPTGVAR